MPPSEISIHVGTYRFSARLEWKLAPQTCAAILKSLPFTSQLIQARWSGESGWVPLGERDFQVTAENATETPGPGEILLYPGGKVSETEILFPYGTTRFACVNGPLKGNHFATISNPAGLAEVGRNILWEGALSFRIDIG